MKRFSTMFLLVSVILAFGWDWNVPSSILVLCAALCELIDTTPRIWRYFREAKRNKTL